MNKNEIIYNMCMTYRHDYGLEKAEDAPSYLSGMTITERKALWTSMEQVYNNCIEPILNEAKELATGDKIVVPKNKKHAEYMVRIGMFYLEQNNAESE